MLSNQAKKAILAYNKTIIHEIDGETYIDSMNYPSLFKLIGEREDFGVQVINRPEEREVLFGNKSSGFEHKGQVFHCYAIKVINTAWPARATR